MEGSSQRDFKSSYKDSPPSEENSDSEAPETDDSPATARVHHSAHSVAFRNLSSITRNPFNPSAQPPDEGQHPENTETKKTEEHITTTTTTTTQIGNPSQIETRDSGTSQRILSFDAIEINLDDTGSSRSDNVNSDGAFNVISGVSSAPLIGEQNSRSSECSTAPFVVPLFREESTSRISNEVSDCVCTPALFENIPTVEEAPKPFIRPVLSNDTGTTEQNRQFTEHPPTTTNIPECESHQLQFQTDPPQELTLQPSTLTKLTYKARTSKSRLPDYNKPSHTPPPSYQESLSYPVIQHQPLPKDYPGMAGFGSRRSSTTTTITKEPLVSIIRLSSPPFSRPPPSLSNSVTGRDGVFLWHSPSDETCNRDNQAQDQYSDHQILALLACIMFWPIGLLAIYYANMANILRSEGIHSTSLIYSKRALLLSLVAFMIGTGVYLTFYLQRQITL